jgi:hypothetical protein
MKRTLAVLAILTLIVPAVANAQTLNIRNTPAVAQIVQSVIAGLSGGVPYRNQYVPQQSRRPVYAPGYAAYQNGYAQGVADARRTTQYNVNNGYRNTYPQNTWNQNWNQNTWNRNNQFQPNARETWRR